MTSSQSRAGDGADTLVLARRLSVALFATGAVYGLNLAFLPLWLSARGLDPKAIGLVLAAPTFFSIFLTPTICAVIDRRDRLASGFVAAALATPIGFAAMAAAPSPTWVAVASVAAATARAPMQSLGDALAFALVAKDARVDYGRVRLWVSAAVLIAMAGGGFALERAPGESIIWIFVAVTGAGALTALAVAPSDRDVDAPAGCLARAAVWRRPSRALVAVIAAAALIQGSHATLYGFASLGWRDQGASDGFIGVIWATGVAAEIGLFALAGRVGVAKRARAFLIFGAAAACARWLIAAIFSPAGWGALVLQASHLASYGATHLGTLYLAAGLAPKDARAQAQGWINSAVAATTMSATALSGALWSMGAAVAYGAMAAMAAAGLCLAVFAGRRGG
ncbi:MAG: MFS transporter [Rhodoblastus sp.]|nr:MAG: MFS transporter [Rhodoblastus sp.]